MTKTYRIVAVLVVLATTGTNAVLGLERTLEYENALNLIITIGRDNNRAMEHVEYLVNEIGSRPSYSMNYLRSCKWAKDEFTSYGLKDVQIEQVSQIKNAYPDEEAKVAYEYLHNMMFGFAPNEAETPIYNVVADIRGSQFPGEYVIVGAHLDCVPMSAGATDNGTGVAAVMEAARILAASEVRPERTIRFVLFGGEEIGLLGSKGYIDKHPELVSQISAVYVMDHGTNYLAGVQATEPLLADLTDVFRDALSAVPETPFKVSEVDYYPRSIACGPYMDAPTDNTTGPNKVVQKGGCAPAPSGCGTSGAAPEPILVKQIASNGDTITAELMIGGLSVKEGSTPLETGEMLRSMGIVLEDDLKSGVAKKEKIVKRGGTDHMPFLDAGIPAFWFQQEETDAVPYHHHTKEDSIDKVIPRFLEHAALVIAIGAFNTANLDHMLSRDKLFDPNTDL